MLARSLAVSSLLTLFAAAQNQALTFVNGTIMHVDVPFAASLVPTGGVTAEAWITYDSSTIGTGWRFPTVLRMDPGPNNASYFLRIEAGQTLANRLLWWVSTPNGNFSISYSFSAGAFLTWTHVAGTYDGTALRLFVNGAQVAQGVGSGQIYNRGGTFRIGNGDTTVVGGETWNGQIDEVRVWPFARSAAAIAATMQTQLGLLPSECSSWNLNGNLNDSSGTNHGAFVGTPVFNPSSLVLNPYPFSGAVNFGNGSGCVTSSLSGVAAIGQVGSNGFGFSCVRAPAAANGLFLLATGKLAAPITILGVDLWLDLTTPNFSTGVTASSLGASVLTLPVPNSSVLTGLGLFAQHFWIDASCVGGLTGSNGVSAIIWP